MEGAAAGGCTSRGPAQREPGRGGGRRTARPPASAQTLFTRLVTPPAARLRVNFGPIMTYSARLGARRGGPLTPAARPRPSPFGVGAHPTPEKKPAVPPRVAAALSTVRSACKSCLARNCVLYLAKPRCERPTRAAAAAAAAAVRMRPHRADGSAPEWPRGRKQMNLYFWRLDRHTHTAATTTTTTEEKLHGRRRGRRERPHFTVCRPSLL